MTIVTLRGQSYNVTDEQVLEAFSNSIDGVLDEGSSQLIFKTANLIYGIDYTDSLPSKLFQFQDFIKKSLGNTAHSLILDSAVSLMNKYLISG